MFAQRLTVISAFAGGCLCTGLIGFWNAESKPRPASVSERRQSVSVSSLAPEPERASEEQPELPRAVPVVDDGSREEIGTSVADVLSRLETAYRIVSAAKTLDTANTSAPLAPVAPEPAPEPQAAIVVPVPEAEPALSAATPEPRPALGAPATVAAATSEAPPPSDAVARVPEPTTYVGEVNTNIHVGDVQVGDRYEIQQLAMIQYLQLLALSSYVGGRLPRSHQPHQTLRTPPRPRYPITAIPNPDNPWGFNFPPRVLVK
jgi:hypothetical protein